MSIEHRMVNYTDERGQDRVALVIKDNGDGTVDIRVSRTAQPNVDKERVALGDGPGRCRLAFPREGER